MKNKKMSHCWNSSKI